MAKQIIVLDRHASIPQFRIAFWVAIPTERRPFYAGPGKTSEWKGATALENADLQSGAVVEIVETIAIPAGASPAQMQGIVSDRWAALSREVTDQNRWVSYGTYYDGVRWTTGGVA